MSCDSRLNQYARRIAPTCAPSLGLTPDDTAALLIEVYELAQTRGASGTPAPDAPAALTALRSRACRAQAAEATLTLFAEMRALTPPILPPLHGEIDPITGLALPGAAAQRGWAAVKATVDAARAGGPLPEPAAAARAGFQARAGQAAAAFQHLPGTTAVRAALVGAARLSREAQSRAYDQIIASLPANARAITAAQEAVLAVDDDAARVYLLALFVRRIGTERLPGWSTRLPTLLALLPRAERERAAAQFQGVPDVRSVIQRGLRRGEERDETLRKLAYLAIVADPRIVAVANDGPIPPSLPIHDLSLLATRITNAATFRAALGELAADPLGAPLLAAAAQSEPAGAAAARRLAQQWCTALALGRCGICSGFLHSDVAHLCPARPGQTRSSILLEAVAQQDVVERINAVWDALPNLEGDDLVDGLIVLDCRDELVREHAARVPERRLGDLVAYLTAQARAVDLPTNRAHALAALAPHLARAADPALLAEARGAAAANSSRVGRLIAFASLADALPHEREELLGAAFAALDEAPDARHRVFHLREAIPVIPLSALRAAHRVLAAVPADTPGLAEARQEAALWEQRRGPGSDLWQESGAEDGNVV
jgi:hypothetical protein